MSVFDEEKLDCDISYLQSISNIPKLKNDLEDMLKKNNFSMKEIKESSTPDNILLASIVNHIESCSIRLAKEYEVSIHAINAFLSLDKAVIGKIPYSCRGAFNATIHIQLASNKFVLHGGSVQQAYKKMHKEVISFLNKYIDLLPDSTKKFVQTKNKEIDSKPELDISSLKNEFTLKAFCNALPKKLDVNFLTGHYEQLENQAGLGSIENVLNAILFHKAISLKYISSDNKGFRTLQKRISLSIYRAFDTIFYTWTYGRHYNDDPIYNLIDQIVLNEELLDFFFFKVKNRTAPISLLFANFAKTNEQKELANDIMNLTLQKDMKDSSLPFEDCSVELQQMLLKELKNSDMGISFKYIKKNLKEYNV